MPMLESCRLARTHVRRWQTVLFFAFFLFWLSPVTDLCIETADRWMIRNYRDWFDVLHHLFFTLLVLTWAAALLLAFWLIGRDHAPRCPQCGVLLTNLRSVLATHQCPSCARRVIEPQPEEEDADLPAGIAQLSPSTSWPLLSLLAIALVLLWLVGEFYFSGLRALRPWVAQTMGDAWGEMLWALADTLILPFLVVVWVWFKRRWNDLTFCCCAQCLLHLDTLNLIDHGRHCPECGQRLLRRAQADADHADAGDTPRANSR